MKYKITTSEFSLRLGRLISKSGKALTIKNGLQKANLVAKRKKPMCSWDVGLFVHAFTQGFGHVNEVVKWASHFYSKGQPKNKHGEEVLNIWELIIQQAIPFKDFKEIRISKYDGTTIFVLNKEGETAKRMGIEIDIFYPDSRKNINENDLLIEDYFVIHPSFLSKIIDIINPIKEDLITVSSCSDLWYKEKV